METQIFQNYREFEKREDKKHRSNSISETVKKLKERNNLRAKKLWELRNRTGCSLDKVSAATGVSSARQNILETRPEEGSTLQTLCKLAEFYKVTPNYFFGLPYKELSEDDEIDISEVNKRVKTLRKASRLSQARLSEAAFITEGVVQRLETKTSEHTKNCRQRIFLNICNALEVTPDDLINIKQRIQE